MGTIQDMIRKLEQFQKDIEDLSHLTVPIISDAKGMIDRQCTREGCESHFKVNAEDWRDLFKDEEVFCPFCRNNSKAEDYIPSAQKKAVVKGIRKLIMDNWYQGTPMSKNIASIESMEEFELNIQCDNCNIRFAVVGAAIFCPCCGHNSVERTAKESVEKILLQMEKISSIEKGLELEFTKDQVANIIKSIIENSLTDCISILQYFCESKYNHLSKTEAPFNAFQNIEKGNKLWNGLKEKGYDTWLTQTEYKYLITSAQRRHLLEHKSGIVDSKYLEYSKDNKYVVGDRIVVNSSDVISLGNIILKLINSISTI